MIDEPHSNDDTAQMPLTEVAMTDLRAFEDALLAALATMAVRSHRRQADLGIAVRRAALMAGPERIHRALLNLEHDGCVDQVVPLTDGGVLVSVTGRGIERLSHTNRSHALAAD